MANPKARAMSLWLYDFVSRFRWLNYRGKIMLMAFVGTHVPLLAIIGYFVLREGTDFWSAIGTLAVALIATLVGTAITLFVLDQLLRPILLTSRGLRRYRSERVLPALPTTYTDEAGTLMADAADTLVELDEVIHQLSFYDRATRLPNREAVLGEIAGRAAAGLPFAVCVLQFGGYERLVSAFDQATADRVLVRIVAALRGLATDGCYLARNEGGMFVMLVHAAGDVDAVARKARDAMKAAAAEIDVGEVRVTPRLSVGIALSPQNGVAAEELLDRAVAALGAAGDSPIPSVNFFSSDAQSVARERFLTEQELRRGLERDEFRLHFQPVVDVALGRVIGGEALIRWQHPERGLLTPAAFMDVAEASGLIEPIGRWVLGEACGEIRRLRGHGRTDLKIAVNLSATQFRDPALRRMVADTVADRGVPPASLELELTESAAMEDRERAARLLRDLRDLGLSIAIDDFGTGYSSMSNLLDLPFDRVKIDRSFVTGIDRGRTNARAICAAVLALAEGLGVEVLAEGVESASEVALLSAMGCRTFQGYHFARPLPPEDFLAFANDLRLTAGLMAPRPAASAIDARRTA